MYGCINISVSVSLYSLYASGYYQLIAIVTHQGRMADSGHYVGWVKNEKDAHWTKYDDDVVTQVTEADIDKLSGGADWHNNYISIYKRIDDVGKDEGAEKK